MTEGRECSAKELNAIEHLRRGLMVVALAVQNKTFTMTPLAALTKTSLANG